MIKYMMKLKEISNKQIKLNNKKTYLINIDKTVSVLDKNNMHK